MTKKKTFWQVQAFQKKAEKRPKSGNAQKKENIKNEQKEKHFFYGKGVFWGSLRFTNICARSIGLEGKYDRGVR